MFIVQFCPGCISRLPVKGQEAIGIAFAYVLPLLNSAINPIIYSSFNSDFRCAFRDIVFKILAMFSWPDKPQRRFQAVETDYEFSAALNSKLPPSETHELYNGNTTRTVFQSSNSGDANIRDNEDEDDLDTNEITESLHIMKRFNSTPKIIIEEISSKDGEESL